MGMDADPRFPAFGRCDLFARAGSCNTASRQFVIEFAYADTDGDRQSPGGVT